MASRALADFDTVGKSAGASFSSLMADFRAAQHRTTVAYQEWSQAVEAFNQAPSGIVEPHTSPGAREMDQSPDASN